MHRGCVQVSSFFSTSQVGGSTPTSATYSLSSVFCFGWYTSIALFLHGADKPELCAVFWFFFVFCLRCSLSFQCCGFQCLFFSFFFHILMSGRGEQAGVLAAVCHSLCCGVVGSSGQWVVGGGRWAEDGGGGRWRAT
jgi:hypothetical protein